MIPDVSFTTVRALVLFALMAAASFGQSGMLTTTGSGADVTVPDSPALVPAIKDSVYPAYRTMLEFLEKEYLPKARTRDVGLWALPGGRELARAPWPVSFLRVRVPGSARALRITVTVVDRAGNRGSATTALVRLEG